jgi:phenylalanyl-tRNA synthetase beta chain
MLVDRGYQEVVNFAFVEEAWEADFAANTNLIRLANPIASQMAVMRSTLFGGLISNLRHQSQAQAEPRSSVRNWPYFHRDAKGCPVEGFHQPWKLAGLAYGGALPEGWSDGGRKVDFLTM